MEMYPGQRDMDAAVADLAARLPDELRDLAVLSYDYRWSWMPGGPDLFASLDEERWRRTGANPVQLLRELDAVRLERAARDGAMVERLRTAVAGVISTPAQHPRNVRGRTIDAVHPVAFMCSEFGVHPSLPIYSGGLGVLAGDILKEASDRGIPMVGVGLMYRSGYFHQRLDTTGWQHEYWLDTNPEHLPAVVVSGPDGRPLRGSVAVDGEEVAFRIWRVDVGNVPLYLLDTDIPGNSPVGRWVTSRLYESNRSIRLAQYAVLGVGGVRALQAMGLDPALFHLNEGHPALAAFELARSGGARSTIDGHVRSKLVFTTHTPVPAGNETYSRDEILPVLDVIAEQSVGREEFLAAGRVHPDDPGEPSGMSTLAIRSAGSVNAVSRRHGEVARSMWHPMFPERPVEDVPIAHVTNGVHVPTWMAPPMRELLDRHLGPGWIRHADDPEVWAGIGGISDAELWEARLRARHDLIRVVRERATTDRLRRGEGLEYAGAVEHTLDPDVLTIGFARRLATYKRLHLVTLDPARALRMLSGDRPVQFLFAGRAHPQDDAAKQIVQQMFGLKGEPDVAGRVAFLEDYDLTLARAVVAGCDLWVNVPRPPLEASGTSGMKAALNGSLNLSVLDGWWPEAYDGTNGWAIDGSVDADHDAQDQRDAAALFDLLENQAVPLFHRRDPAGIPTDWVAMVRRSLMTIGPRFSATRMLGEYLQTVYSVPGAEPQPVVPPTDAVREHLRTSHVPRPAPEPHGAEYTTAWSLPDIDPR